jgi:hypothetical protein
METNTLIDVASGFIVLLGVYAVFHLLRFVADVVIVLIAIAVAIAACSLHSWYAPMVEICGFLPPALDFKGRVICVVMLILAGALLALPIIPFSSIMQNLRHSGANRSRRNRRLLAGQCNQSEDHMYHWDNVQDL